MLNILINDLSYHRLAIRISTVSRVKYWLNQKCRITILTNENGKKFYKKISPKITFFTVPKTKLAESKFGYILESFKRNLSAVKFIKKSKKQFDIIFSISSVLDLIIFPFLLKKINPKIIWATIFDNIVPFNDPGNKIYRFLGWFFFKISLPLIHSADIIFTISLDLKKYLIHHKFNSSKIIITSNAVKVDLIKKSKAFKKKYDALFIGRINETKGIFDMVKVVNNIKKEIPGFKLAIIFDLDIKTKNRLIKKIKDFNLSQNIILLGTIIGLKKFSIIKSSKIFIFLSKSESESFGIALLEAVSCGLPAFVYNLPAYKNIYQNKEINTFNIGDINSISKSIINTFKYKKFQNKNGKKLLGLYNWENIANLELKTFIKFYQSQHL